MLLWSYFTVVFTDPGCVPPNWRPVVDEEKADSVPIEIPELGTPISGSQVLQEILADASNPRVRYCRKCNSFKPPRCHHCSVCECMNHNFVVKLFILPVKFYVSSFRREMCA